MRIICCLTFILASPVASQINFGVPGSEGSASYSGSKLCNGSFDEANSVCHLCAVSVEHPTDLTDGHGIPITSSRTQRLHLLGNNCIPRQQHHRTLPVVLPWWEKLHQRLRPWIRCMLSLARRPLAQRTRPRTIRQRPLSLDARPGMLRRPVPAHSTNFHQPRPEPEPQCQHRP